MIFIIISCHFLIILDEGPIFVEKVGLGYKNLCMIFCQSSSSDYFYKGYYEFDTYFYSYYYLNHNNVVISMNDSFINMKL